MEENVALESSKQKKFVKSIKGIKKLIKKNQKEEKVIDENDVKKPADGVKKQRKRPERGLVYLSHIPHGFYENEMTQYFKQFGMVTNVRVIRSKHTGNSKGHAFVEFKEPAVGQIVAETMNNYLMGKRLIKAVYIPPEKQKRAFRKRWSREHNPGQQMRLKCKKAYNENKDNNGELKRARKILSNLNKTKSKLSEMGINYDFFTPVDVPEALTAKIENKQTKDEQLVKKQKDVKKEVKDIKKVGNDTKKVQNDTKKVQKDTKKEQKVVKQEKSDIKVENKKSVETKKTDSKKDNKAQVNQKEQNDKNKKLKDAGIKPMGNFVRINQDQESDEDDSSVGFDSDEYEKMLEDDSDVDSELDQDSDDEQNSEDDEQDDGEEVDSSDVEDDGSDVEDESESEEEEIIPPPKKVKGKKGPVVPQVQLVKKNENKKKEKPVPQNVKRKVPQKAVTVSNTKKPNFEKQTQQPMKKQFKKKK